MKKCFESAKQFYADLGVDVEAAFERLNNIPVSMHCWQGDDVAGFENAGSLDGGLAVTGNYPGRARNAAELRDDIAEVLKLIPGKKRLNIHAIYAETNGKKVERNELDITHFANWVEFAKAQQLGLDFNPTFFAHPLATDGSLSSADDKVRQFWIEHGIACRKIGAEMGKQLGNTCVTNVWIPDGSKDTPFDRLAPRQRLMDSLDAMFAEKIDPKYNIDAVESKLFGIGAESYTVGSHEFYMGYAVSRGKALCLDAGHFHPTEVISDKISSALLYLDDVLLHVSRGVRWDSDHVVCWDGELQAIASEIVRHGYEKRVHIGLDYFDASINRLTAWCVGMRNTYKALLFALLEPAKLLADAENSNDKGGRLFLLEELKNLPFAPVWAEYCDRCGVPDGFGTLEAIRKYECDVLSKRN
ncbi:MAG: L-rhamnose isomerase [Lentisphaerae bacterium]|nr:L-rhamnose isomerase [Lentisphaerota bacterium]